MTTFEHLMEVCLKRAIIYPDSEPHGAIAGFYDYGSVGSEIKRRFENEWRNYFLNVNDNYHEIETCSIMPEKVFKASGHLDHFFDPIAECGKCHTKSRADHLLEDVLGEKFEGLDADRLNELIKEHNLVCPKCKSQFKDIENFIMMFPVTIGAGDSTSLGYLRPETAQGPYSAFKREFRANRQRLPLGLGIVGRAYRNEISPRQATIRQREFTQAELQIFFDPEEEPEVPFDKVADKLVRLWPQGAKKVKEVTAKEAMKVTGMSEFFVYHLALVQDFFRRIGLYEHVRAYEVPEAERAFYNKYQWDHEIFMPSMDKWLEVMGFHYRTDYDLKSHSKATGEKMNVPGKGYVPHVLELSFGVDRCVLALLDTSYKKDDKREWFALNPLVAPWDVGVYPLVNKDKLPQRAREIQQLLKLEGLKVFYDSGGSIGRRYARADEIGVTYGVTIDFDTLEDDTVTVRFRDSTEQKRVKISDLPSVLK